jgi:uncharacterized protein YfaS (alpha-2-macroglobulin family)
MVWDANYRFPTSVRKFRVNEFQHQDYFVTLDFDKDAYLPDTVIQTKLRVIRPDGLPLSQFTAVSISLEHV